MKPQFLILSFLIGVGSGSVADAQIVTCIPAASMERLLERWGETPIFHGLTEGISQIYTAYLNEETGAWTLIMRSADGLACRLASGSTGWRPAPVEMGDPL